MNFFKKLGRAIEKYAPPVLTMGMVPGKSFSNGSNAAAPADPNAQARSDAATAMKRQAGGAQISFTGNNETPASSA
jgi:hypothetical protein